MNKKRNTSLFVTLALLVAIMMLFQFTGIGFIQIGVISITFMCLPVIIGTLTLGLVPGLILGGVFGALSFYSALTAPSALMSALMMSTGLASLTPVIFIPRLLIPVFTHLVWRALKNVHEKFAIGLAALVGSLTNTVFFLGMLWLFWGETLASYFGVASPAMVMVPIGTIVLTNGLPEAIAAVLVSIPVIHALKRAMPKLFGRSA